MTIERIDMLCKNPRAVSLALEAVNVLRAHGWLHETVCGLSYNSKALLAIEEEAAVGVMVYQTIDWKNCIDLEIGYVAAAHREQGVYRALWAELCCVAKEQGVPVISGSTHVENTVMQAVMGRLDRPVKWLQYEFRVQT